MFKGILALFKSGLIVNPMVLLGIVFGIVSVSYLSLSDIYKLFQDWHFYLFVMLCALVYNLIFRKRYHEGAIGLDFATMFQNSLGSAAMFLISLFCSISFVTMFLL